MTYCQSLPRFTVYRPTKREHVKAMRYLGLNPRPRSRCADGMSLCPLDQRCCQDWVAFETEPMLDMDGSND